MNSLVENVVKKLTGAQKILTCRNIQTLWSGYGQILRLQLKNATTDQVIVKHIRYPDAKAISSPTSHNRKMRSYQIELRWYQQFASNCNQYCRIPCCLGTHAEQSEIVVVLEDLTDSGFSKQHRSANQQIAQTGLRWLAHFHAAFMAEKPRGLWKTGTYWHLATRKEELNRLGDQSLKKAALAIDTKLRQSPFQTIVHGDAKLANFCFSKNGKSVAAIDFQYVGGGCGMKDVAYFLDSCFPEATCERLVKPMLDYYFSVLRKALLLRNKAIDLNALEENWRVLYPVAWTDFYRFLKGWTDGYWDPTSYSERLAKEVIKKLGS
ncbi:phosphotransferase [Chitinispirillales bacterium ANBcel5]|uniref:phosphotransferase n=1 Tax=Cellulosispirillum alkaliphilum TaxID=3039283 RepID=UPI002A5073C4|nr:phosphotransferase [Chitinispirillales bacterium ANBcel5]